MAGRLLAEGLVISAGVFLGLLADDWREARSRAQQARDLLVLVREDLRTDSAEISSILNGLGRHLALGPWLLRNRGLATAPDSVEIITSPWLFRRYQRVRPSYAALTAGGQLSLIDDAELRAATVGYFDREQEDFMQARTDWLNVRERLIEEWNEYMRPTASAAFAGYFSTPDELGGEADWEGLRRDHAGAMIALRFSGLSEVLVMRGEATLAANARLAAMLDALLDDRRPVGAF